MDGSIFKTRLATALHFSLLLAATAQAQQAPAQPAAPSATLIQTNGYAQLHVALSVNGDDRQKITFDQCPNRKLWRMDFSAPLGEEDEADIALIITNPGGTAITLRPVTINYHRTWLSWLGISYSCSVAINRIDFTSPMYYVRKNDRQPFTVNVTVSRLKNSTPVRWRR